MNLNNCSDSEILKMRLCDLPLSIEKSAYGPLCQSFFNELKLKGLCFKPSIWISDDWFCPDGVTGFALPFFLLHPRLIEIERKMIGHVEGEDSQWFLKLLRHECGHAMDNAFFLKDCQRRVEIFGDHNIEYPSSYEPKLYSKKFVRHLEDGYAQAHPEEDWAETFATWLDPKSRWRTLYRDWPAIEKIKYVDRIMKKLKGARPNVLCYQKVDSIEELDISLRTYYNRKRKRLLLESNESHLHRYLLKSPRQMNEGAYLYGELKRNRRDLQRMLSVELKRKNHQVASALKDLEGLAKKKGLYIKKSSNHRLEGLVRTHAKKFFKEGKHRIIM